MLYSAFRVPKLMCSAGGVHNGRCTNNERMGICMAEHYAYGVGKMFWPSMWVVYVEIAVVVGI